MKFTHLHLHTQFSLLDGAIRLKDLFPRLDLLGMDAVAITDHGNMYGVLPFYKQAKAHGIKPIIGCEVYVAGPKGRKDRTERYNAHMVLLAKNNEGYKNLCYLVSMAYRDGYYYKPRIDTELLKGHTKGLFASSACLSGVINKILMRGPEFTDRAYAYANELKALFDPDHFFLELQDNGYKDQEHVNKILIQMSGSLDIPLVATADAHYLTRADSEAHEYQMCIGLKHKSIEEFRAKFEHTDQLYVKSPEEMIHSSLPAESVTNTTRIAEQCNVELDLNVKYTPKYKGAPNDVALESKVLLRTKAAQGLDQRINATLTPSEAQRFDFGKQYLSRLDYELDVIERMGFCDYFLIVWDFVRFAKSKGIPVGPGRGSGAGSLVAWALGITDLDPIAHGLIFERFLNPDRVSMPDFDVDFCQERRGEVIDYVTDKYGDGYVAQIVTHSELGGKSVIKDVARVMGVSFAEVNEITKLIPSQDDQGRKATIKWALEIEPKLAEIQIEKPIYKEIIRIARALEGLQRHAGVHAAGVVIADRPLWHCVPTCRAKDGGLVTQFAMDEAEESGLVKFDFLGLKTLTVIDKAIKYIPRWRIGPSDEFGLDKIPLNDPKVYAMISRGDTDGVFQLESSGFKDLLKRLEPECFEEIVAAVALYRPGPLLAGLADDYVARKRGEQDIVYPHPSCESILAPTYGVLVYQEQVMQLAVTLCGFTMAQADTLRKAMGKKKPEVMAKQREAFVEGAVATSALSVMEATELFDSIEKFAGYAFNKSHSAAYAVITYQTAYLKAHYPAEFMAALLSTEMNAQGNLVKYLRSCKAHGIKIAPPDLNRSVFSFSVVPDGQGYPSILFGLGAIKGLGESAVDAIVQAREEGPYKSIYDFCGRVDLRKVKRSALELLVKSGAADCLGRPRWLLHAVVSKAVAYAQSRQRDKESGQGDMFGEPPPLAKPPADECEEWTEHQRLRYEREALGCYVSAHPLDSYESDMQNLCDIDCHRLNLMREQLPYNRITPVIFAGVIAALKERPLKSGKGYIATALLEDLTGTSEVIVYSKAYALYQTLLRSDEPLIFQGRVIVDGEGADARLKVQIVSARRLAEIDGDGAKTITIDVSASKVDRARLVRLKRIFDENPGKVPVHLRVVDYGVAEAVVALSDGIDPTAGMLAAAKGVFC
jgi:DNA polymerase-3 subunit alpha